MALGCFKATSFLDSLSTQSYLHNLKEGKFWWDAFTGSTEMFHQMLTWELCACARPL